MNVKIKQLREVAETEENPHVLSRALGKALDECQWLSEHLIETANQLDEWARQSQVGGWSTHQVESMRKKADELRRIAAS